GIKAGVTIHNVDFNRIYPTLPDPEDGVFSGNNPSETFLNVGSGVFYYTDKYYIAFSMPNMLKAKYLDYNGTNYGSEELHYFLTGGYVFDLSQSVKFKPFAMLKSSLDVDPSLDVSANFLFNERFEIGGTYRLDD